MLEASMYIPLRFYMSLLAAFNSYVFDRTRTPVEKITISNRLKSFEVQLKGFVSHSVNCN